MTKAAKKTMRSTRNGFDPVPLNIGSTSKKHLSAFDEPFRGHKSKNESMRSVFHG
jgi:hypothetical protein